MPVIVSPTVTAIPQGNRIAAHYEYDGNEAMQTSIMGTFFNNVLAYRLDFRSVQVPANLKSIRTVQFSLVMTGSPIAGILQTGTFYIVVDTLQVFSFELVRNPEDVEGAQHTSMTATIPIQSTSQSTIDFLVWLPNYVLGIPFAELYVNCFDFDVAPFVAPSHVVFLNPQLTITGTVPVDVVNTSMNVFVNNPVDLPVPVNQV